MQNKNIEEIQLTDFENIEDREFDDAITVKASNFELIPRELGEINRVLNELFQLSPIGSTLDVVFNKNNFDKNNEEISCLLKINSRIKNFQVTKIAQNLQDAFFQAHSQVLEEINTWKKSRF